MRKLLYTCISGNYDSRKRHIIPPDWDFIEMNLAGGRLRAREMKILTPFFDQYDLSVWMDGSMGLHGDLNELVAKYHHCDLTTIQHYARYCVYQEVAACIEAGKETSAKATALMLRYKSEGYPENAGMVASGMMIRNHTNELREFCMKWFDMVKHHSERDQLSFNYLTWKHKFKYRTITWSEFQRYFKKNKHIK